MSEITVKFDPEDIRQIQSYVDRRVAKAVAEIRAELDRQHAELRGFLAGATASKD